MIIKILITENYFAHKFINISILNIINFCNFFRKYTVTFVDKTNTLNIIFYYFLKNKLIGMLYIHTCLLRDICKLWIVIT